MASISSGANGPWSSPSTWTGGVVPGLGDAVTIAGHTVTVDQNVEIDSIVFNGLASVVFTGSVGYSFTTGALDTPNSNWVGFIFFDSLYTATDAVINLGEVTMAAYTNTTALGIVMFDGSSGEVYATIDSFWGDTSTSGNEPDLFYYRNDATTSLNLTILGLVRQNRSYLVNPSLNTSSIPLLEIDITNATFYAATSDAYLLYYNQRPIAKTIINGDLDWSLISTNTAFLNTANSALFESEFILNGDLTVNTAQSTGVITSPGRITINGDIAVGPGNWSVTLIGGAGNIDVYGDVTVSNTPPASTLPLTAAVIRVDNNRLVHIHGNLLAENGAVIFAPSPTLAYSPTVTVGDKNSGNTHTITGVNGGVPIHGNLLNRVHGVFYEITVPLGDNWPDASTNTITLRSTGAGPSITDTRKDVAYVTGAKGVVSVPPPDSVRAGISVDDTVGVALVSTEDLANITGGQVATLSE